MLQANDSTVVLDPVSYGTNGSWAISLWMQPSPAGLTGTQFEYIYSQNNSAEAYPTGWEPNQVRAQWHVGFVKRLSGICRQYGPKSCCRQGRRDLSHWIYA